MNSYFLPTGPPSYPPPPYEEQHWSRSHHDNLSQHQVQRKPVLPPRPKTANSRGHARPLNTADHWAGDGSMKAVAGSGRNHSPWDTTYRVPVGNSDMYSAPTDTKLGPGRQHSTNMLILGDLHNIHPRAHPLTNCGYDSYPQTQQSSQPNIVIATETRPQTAGSRNERRIPNGFHNPFAGYSSAESMAGLNFDHSRWEAPRPQPVVDTRPRTADSKAVARERNEQSKLQWAGSSAVASMAGLNMDHSQWESHRPSLTVNTSQQNRLHTAESGARISAAVTRSYSPSPALSMGSLGPSLLPSPRTPSPLPSPTALIMQNPEIPSPLSLPVDSKLQKAFKDARHYAGGLIPHPVESTKHYSILRHSVGLVMYKGPSTTVAVSIFSDQKVTADSTLWLQNKGFSGKTGMQIKTLFGATSSWINVTPTKIVRPDQVNGDDERAWQRDISDFRKKVAGQKREQHILRTTAIVAIPPEAEDGYYQLVLCIGDRSQVLCTSPCFRIASTSSSPHSIRGASLMTLPLELTAMAGSMYIKATAGRVVGPAASAVSVATGQVQKYLPSAVTQQIVSSAISQAQVAEKIISVAGSLRDQSLQAREASYSQAGASEIALALEHGPQSPYPLSFIGSIQTARIEHTDLACAKMSQISELITRKLHGHYFGWARFLDEKRKGSNDCDWNQAIVSVLTPDASQLVKATITEANKRVATVLFIGNSELVTVVQSSLEVKVMGFIRPDDPSHRAGLTNGLNAGDQAAVEAAIAIYHSDVYIAQSFLNHPAWNPACLAIQGKSERPGGLSRMKSSFADTVSKIPLDKMSIRSPIDGLRDKPSIATGLWVNRACAQA